MCFYFLKSSHFHLILCLEVDLWLKTLCEKIFGGIWVMNFFFGFLFHYPSCKFQFKCMYWCDINTDSLHNSCVSWIKDDVSGILFLLPFYIYLLVTDFGILENHGHIYGLAHLPYIFFFFCRIEPICLGQINLDLGKIDFLLFKKLINSVGIML